MHVPTRRYKGLGAALGLMALTASCRVLADSGNTVSGAPVELKTVSVIGRGQTRQVEAVTRADIEESAPGTSPIKVVDKLPGVNFQSADPFGNYEWAVRISVRGFNQDQMGFTLDDMPLGDMFYSN